MSEAHDSYAAGQREEGNAGAGRLCAAAAQTPQAGPRSETQSQADYAPSYFLKTRQALAPPKPKVFESTAPTSARRAAFGT